MKITIITVVLNRVNTIREAIESVLSQDYSNVEYIIVDGGSTDGTLDVINEYSQRVDKIISESNDGMYEAINRGIELASGDYIGLVHSDDKLENTHVISDIVRCAKEANADIVYGDGEYYDDKGRLARKWRGGNFHKWKTFFVWLPLHTATYIRRECYLRLGMYDPTFKIAGDTDLLIRFLKENNLNAFYYPHTIIRMRMGGLSTNRRNRMKVWREDIAVFRKHGMRPAFIYKCMKMLWKVPQIMCKI